MIFSQSYAQHCTQKICTLRDGYGYTHNIFYWGSAAAYCFCSPAGRCGLIGLSCFLLSPMCFQSLRFSHSFLIPSTQPLSAPLTSVALSLHYTSHRTVIPQSACNPLPMGLYSNQKIQTLPKLLQAVIAPFLSNNRSVPFSRYPYLCRP